MNWTIKEKSKSSIERELRGIKIKKEHGDRYGYVFMTSNSINGNVCIGASSSWADFNSYYGYPPRLRADIASYGKNNFIKKILCYANDQVELDYYAILELMRARRDYGYDNIYNNKISLGGNPRLQIVIGMVLEILNISYDELFNDAGKVHQLLLDKRNEMLEVIGIIYQ